VTAFSDLLDLQTAVIELVKRPDIAEVMPRLVVLAETEFNRRLRCRQQMAAVVVTIANGQGPLPDDFLEPVGLFDTSGQEYIQAPVHIVEDGQDRGHYAIVGDDLLCNADGDKTLSYYAKVPTISESMTDSNWLLTASPGLYLYGVGYEAAKFIGDADRARLARDLMEMEFAATAAADASARFGRASVRLRGVFP
jgi:hypothetical protein